MSLFFHVFLWFFFLWLLLRQVLPFLLRRVKEDVLDDLPPKIIQDYYCDLSPLQLSLYESLGQSGTKAAQVVLDFAFNVRSSSHGGVSFCFLSL